MKAKQSNRKGGAAVASSDLLDDTAMLNWLATKSEVHYGDMNEDVWVITLPRTNNELREAIKLAMSSNMPLL